jgi:CubicO group peptidase (beta-lactamase class C family)
MRFFPWAIGGLLGLALIVVISTILPQKSSAIQLAPTSIAAPESHAPDPVKIESIWRDWTNRYEIDQSAIALGYNKAVFHTAEAGRSADAPYPVASLSKAVTAMCLNDLLEQTEHSWSSPLSELTSVWQTLGTTPHPTIARLPLSAFATHTSGLPRNIEANKKAPTGRNTYTQAHFARTAFQDPNYLSADRTHTYSNVNYAILGQIIEGITKQTYGEYCYHTVMAPAGAETAKVGGRMWATAGFGGWSVSAREYARFLLHWYAPEQPWLQNPQSYALDRKSGAGLGVFNQYDRNHHILNHTGKWTSKVTQRNIGALFVTSQTGAVFVANWQGALPNTAYNDLRENIIAALH